MKFGSLFSGIGGLDLGLERAGMECRWQVEIDPYCTKVLTKHWPAVPKFGDIRELTGAEIEPVDLICGGFPCQPVSKAGSRRGIADDRWLWPDFARLVRILRPELVLVENVSGLASLGMGIVLGDLSALGYDAEWTSVPAAAFGAHHIRDQIYILAYPNCNGGKATQGLLARPRAFYQPLLLDQAKVSGAFWQSHQHPVCGVFDGPAGGLDRLRGLGNAVVPQVAEWIGRRILAGEGY